MYPSPDDSVVATGAALLRTSDRAASTMAPSGSSDIEDL